MASRPAWTLIVEDRFGTVTDEHVFDAGALVIGRSRQSDIVLPSESVSRSHARALVEAGRLYMEDLGSSNGIWLDGDRVEGRVEVGDGSVVRVGDFLLRIRGGKGSSESSTVYARLIGCSPGAMDQTLDVVAPTTLVGRGRDCGLVLVDPSVSRVHSRLRVRPDGVILVEDVASANGLFVNETRVKVWQLSAGDRVRFGNVEFLVEIPDSGTVEIPVYKGSPFSRRMKVLLPFAIGLLAVVMLIVLGAIIVPGMFEAESEVPGDLVPADGFSSPDQSSSSDLSVTPPASALAIEKARAFLAAGRLDAASGALIAIPESDPMSFEAVALSNRIESERVATRALFDADQALQNGQIEIAISRLMSFSVESPRFPEAKVRLQALRPILLRKQREACVGHKITSVPCIRSRSLLAKVEVMVR